MKGIEIIPTNTCPPDLATLTKTTEFLSSFARTIQLDISDGLFSSVTSWPYGFDEDRLSMAAGKLKLPLSQTYAYEIHLMVEEPREIGIELAKAGAMRILAHVEAFDDTTKLHGTLDAWRSAGAKEAGIAALMHTPLETIEAALAGCDVVQFMTIPRIGAQGAPFADGAIERVADFHRRHPEMRISVDGSVSEKNIADLARAGATRFGVGSAISKAADPAAAYAQLVALAEEAVISP